MQPGSGAHDIMGPVTNVAGGGSPFHRSSSPSSTTSIDSPRFNWNVVDGIHKITPQISALAETKQVVDQYMSNKICDISSMPISEAVDSPKALYPLTEDPHVLEFYHSLQIKNNGKLAHTFLVHFFELFDGGIFENNDMASLSTKEKRMVLVFGVFQADAMNGFPLLNRLYDELDKYSTPNNVELKKILDISLAQLSPVKITLSLGCSKNDKRVLPKDFPENFD